MAFNYEDKGAPKLSDEFKAKFVYQIKGGKDAIKADGLVALAHEKGLKSMNVKIVQYPNQDNQWTCIASCKVIGYDWSPIEQKVVEVEFEDFADANAANCTAMTKTSYIRMASTRAVGRALRKYTNVDMVTSEEIGETMAPSLITYDQINAIKEEFTKKGMQNAELGQLMYKMFNHTVMQNLSQDEGEKLIAAVKNYTPMQPETSEV